MGLVRIGAADGHPCYGAYGNRGGAFLVRGLLAANLVTLAAEETP
jgi:hypothetical protein